LLPIECFERKKDKIDEYNKCCKVCIAKRKISRDKSKCSHGRDKTKCPDCDGPNICCHKKLLKYCIICDGHSLCPHDKMKSRCKECDIKNYIKVKLMKRMNNVVDNAKFSDVGCNLDELMIHIENQLKEDMNFDNFGEVWQLSYKLPIGLKELDKEEVIRRFHYTNIYPSYPYSNMIKKKQTI